MKTPEPPCYDRAKKIDCPNRQPEGACRTDCAAWNDYEAEKAIFYEERGKIARHNDDYRQHMEQVMSKKK